MISNTFFRITSIMNFCFKSQWSIDIMNGGFINDKLVFFDFNQILQILIQSLIVELTSLNHSMIFFKMNN